MVRASWRIATWLLKILLWATGLIILWRILARGSRTKEETGARL